MIRTKIHFLLAVAFLSGCAVKPVKPSPAPYGKIWRGIVTQQMIDTAPAKNNSKVATPNAENLNLRMTGVSIEPKMFSKSLAARLPDSLEFSHVPVGTVVDVMVENDADAKKTQNFTRILWVICPANNAKCIDHEQRSGRIKAVVDNEPGDVLLRYGHHYNRPLVESDRKKFK